MTSVFIAGSRSITRLPTAVTKRIDNVLKQELTVLVGDASGADKAVQKYLQLKLYKNVIIFCMQNRCRTNLGGWPIQAIEEPPKTRGFDFYALKDKAMAEQASYGFMIWDGQSNGTLNNMLNLLNQQKRCWSTFQRRRHFIPSPSKAICQRSWPSATRNTLSSSRKSLGRFFLLPSRNARSRSSLSSYNTVQISTA